MISSDHTYFSAQEYQDLMFNISQVPAKSTILKHFPLLGKCHEFKLPLIVELEPERKATDKTSKPKKKLKSEEDAPEIRELDREKVLRYIIYLYDMGSKINVRKDPKEMRKYAAINAGFSHDEKGDLPIEVRMMMRGEVENVNFMIIRFCRLFHNMVYSQLVTTTIAYFKIEKKLVSVSNTFKEDDLRGKIYSTHKEMADDIEALFLKLLSNDKNQWMSESLFRCIESDIDEELMLSPEKMAMNGGEDE